MGTRGCPLKQMSLALIQRALPSLPLPHLRLLPLFSHSAWTRWMMHTLPKPLCLFTLSLSLFISLPLSPAQVRRGSKSRDPRAPTYPVSVSLALCLGFYQKCFSRSQHPTTHSHIPPIPNRGRQRPFISPPGFFSTVLPVFVLYQKLGSVSPHCLTQRRCPGGPLGAPCLETRGPSSSHVEGSVVGGERRTQQHVVSFKRSRIRVKNLVGSTPVASARPPVTFRFPGLLFQL